MILLKYVLVMLFHTGLVISSQCKHKKNGCKPPKTIPTAMSPSTTETTKTPTTMSAISATTETTKTPTRTPATMFPANTAGETTATPTTMSLASTATETPATATTMSPVSTTTKTTTPTIISPASTTAETTKTTRLTSRSPTPTAKSSSAVPLDGPLYTAAKVIQSIGCVYLIAAITTTIIIYLILRDFSHERCLHMSQEVALLAAHLIIAFFWNKTENKFICKFAVFGIQYFFLAAFIFIALEAIHYFTILTNVVRKGAYLTRLQVQVIGWSLPAIVIILTSLGHEYISPPWSCWLNYRNELVLTTVMPIVICSVISTVMTEAAGMYKKLPRVVNTSEVQKTAALANRSAMVILLPLQMAAWSVGSYALYRMYFWMFPTVLALNISLGTAIFIFHSLGNPKVHELFYRHVVYRFKARKVAPSTEDVKPKSKRLREKIKPLSPRLVKKVDDKINSMTLV